MLPAQEFGRRRRLRGFGKKGAVTWYSVAMKLNPYDANNWLNTGRCLDWIDSTPGGGKESIRYYQRANELDPNNYYISGQTSNT